MTGNSLTDVSVQLPTWAEVISVLTLSAGYNSAVVVAGTTCLGLAGGVTGTFLLLRKRALLSDTLAHSALPGLCIAFLVAIFLGIDGRQLWLLLFGASVSGVLAVFTVQFLLRNTRLGADAVIGAVLSVFFGVGIVLLSVIQSLATGSEGGINNFIYGQTAALRLSDVYWMISIALLAVVIALLFIKEFRVVCFDEEFAEVQGYSISAVDFIMMLLVTLVIVVGLQAVGVILVVAILIIPAAAARFWTERFDKMTILSALIGAGSGYVGASLSALMPRMPAGAIIVVCAGIIFFISFLFAPKRGLVAGTYRRLRQQFKIAEDHLLRELFEKIESTQSASSTTPSATSLFGTPTSALQSLYQGRNFRLHLAVWILQLRGLLRINRKAQTITLTSRGLAKAEQRVRNHRLWEQFLVSYGHMATSHVDYSADLVEHVLSDDIVRELENSLQKHGELQLKDKPKAPPSVHPIG